MQGTPSILTSGKGRIDLAQEVRVNLQQRARHSLTGKISGVSSDPSERDVPESLRHSQSIKQIFDASQTIGEELDTGPFNEEILKITKKPFVGEIRTSGSSDSRASDHKQLITLNSLFGDLDAALAYEEELLNNNEGVAETDSRGLTAEQLEAIKKEHKKLILEMEKLLSKLKNEDKFIVKQKFNIEAEKLGNDLLKTLGKFSESNTGVNRCEKIAIKITGELGSRINDLAPDIIYDQVNMISQQKGIDFLHEVGYRTSLKRLPLYLSLKPFNELPPEMPVVTKLRGLDQGEDPFPEVSVPFTDPEPENYVIEVVKPESSENYVIEVVKPESSENYVIELLNPSAQGPDPSPDSGETSHFYSSPFEIKNNSMSTQTGETGPVNPEPERLVLDPTESKLPDLILPVDLEAITSTPIPVNPEDVAEAAANKAVEKLSNLLLNILPGFLPRGPENNEMHFFPTNPTPIPNNEDVIDGGDPLGADKGKDKPSPKLFSSIKFSIPKAKEPESPDTSSASPSIFDHRIFDHRIFDNRIFDNRTNHHHHHYHHHHHHPAVPPKPVPPPVPPPVLPKPPKPPKPEPPKERSGRYKLPPPEAEAGPRFTFNLRHIEGAGIFTNADLFIQLNKVALMPDDDESEKMDSLVTTLGATTGHSKYVQAVGEKIDFPGDVLKGKLLDTLKSYAEPVEVRGEQLKNSLDINQLLRLFASWYKEDNVDRQGGKVAAFNTRRGTTLMKRAKVSSINFKPAIPELNEKVDSDSDS